MTSLEKLLAELETAIKEQCNLNFYEEHALKFIEIIRVQNEALDRAGINYPNDGESFIKIDGTEIRVDVTSPLWNYFCDLKQVLEKVEAIAKGEA